MPFTIDSEIKARIAALPSHRFPVPPSHEPRQGAVWTREEDSLLFEMLASDATTGVVARLLGRSTGAIGSRVRKHRINSTIVYVDADTLDAIPYERAPLCKSAKVLRWVSRLFPTHVQYAVSDDLILRGQKQ